MPGQPAVAVVHAQQVDHQTQETVLFMVPLPVRHRHAPKGLDHADTVLVGDGILDDLGKAHGIGGLRFQPLRIRFQRLCGLKA